LGLNDMRFLLLLSPHYIFSFINKLLELLFYCVLNFINNSPLHLTHLFFHLLPRFDPVGVKPLKNLLKQFLVIVFVVPFYLTIIIFLITVLPGGGHAGAGGVGTEQDFIDVYVIILRWFYIFKDWNLLFTLRRGGWRGFHMCLVNGRLHRIVCG